MRVGPDPSRSESLQALTLCDQLVGQANCSRSSQEGKIRTGYIQLLQQPPDAFDTLDNSSSNNIPSKCERNA